MGIFDDLKKLVKKAVKSPIKAAIVYFLIKDILSKNVENYNAENFVEQVKTIKTKGKRKLVQDLESGQYAVINGTDISYYKNLGDAKKALEESVEEDPLVELKEKYVK